MVVPDFNPATLPPPGAIGPVSAPMDGGGFSIVTFVMAGIVGGLFLFAMMGIVIYASSTTNLQVKKRRFSHTHSNGGVNNNNVNGDSSSRLDLENSTDMYRTKSLPALPILGDESDAALATSFGVDMRRQSGSESKSGQNFIVNGRVVHVPASITSGIHTSSVEKKLPKRPSFHIADQNGTLSSSSSASSSAASLPRSVPASPIPNDPTSPSSSSLKQANFAPVSHAALKRPNSQKGPGYNSNQQDFVKPFRQSRVLSSSSLGLSVQSLNDEDEDSSSGSGSTESESTGGDDESVGRIKSILSAADIQSLSSAPSNVVLVNTVGIMAPGAVFREAYPSPSPSPILSPSGERSSPDNQTPNPNNSNKSRRGSWMDRRSSSTSLRWSLVTDFLGTSSLSTKPSVAPNTSSINNGCPPKRSTSSSAIVNLISRNSPTSNMRSPLAPMQETAENSLFNTYKREPTSQAPHRSASPPAVLMSRVSSAPGIPVVWKGEGIKIESTETQRPNELVPPVAFTMGSSSSSPSSSVPSMDSFLDSTTTDRLIVHRSQGSSSSTEQENAVPHLNYPQKFPPNPSANLNPSVQLRAPYPPLPPPHIFQSSTVTPPPPSVTSVSPRPRMDVVFEASDTMPRSDSVSQFPNYVREEEANGNAESKSGRAKFFLTPSMDDIAKPQTKKVDGDVRTEDNATWKKSVSRNAGSESKEADPFADFD
ncbi:hypothetical protein HDV05_008479 [Chytridiales sp. JEL 0842]|nr:hypothetical protein HDV05_008479 [Chytridiales sp. JEL 0842]